MVCSFLLAASLFFLLFGLNGAETLNSVAGDDSASIHEAVTRGTVLILAIEVVCGGAFQSLQVESSLLQLSLAGETKVGSATHAMVLYHGKYPTTTQGEYEGHWNPVAFKDKEKKKLLLLGGKEAGDAHRGLLLRRGQLLRSRIFFSLGERAVVPRQAQLEGYR